MTSGLRRGLGPEVLDSRVVAQFQDVAHAVHLPGPFLELVRRGPGRDLLIQELALVFGKKPSPFFKNSAEF